MTNKIFEENELGERLRLLNRIIFCDYGICLFLFMLLYARYEAGRINLLVALIPIVVMFGIMLAITKLISKFNPAYLPEHLANNAEFAKKYYSGRLLLDNAFLVKNVLVLVIVLMALMFVIRFIV
jgi:hypothetical protein